MSLIEFLWFWVGTLGSLAAIGLALWLGGRYERTAAAAYLVSLFLTWWLHVPGAGFDWVVMTIDSAVCVTYIGLALRARRIWSLFMAAFAVNTVLSHLIILIDPGLDKYVYATGLGLWGGYGLMLALAFGVWEHRILTKAQSASRA